MNYPSGITMGLCFKAKCPMCFAQVEFALLVRMLAPGSDYLVLGVVCRECGFEVTTTDDSERDKLSTLAGVWRRHEAGELTEDAAEALQAELSPALMQRIHEEGKTWFCPACHAESPQTVSTCWKCGYDSIPDEPTEGPFET